MQVRHTDLDTSLLVRDNPSQQTRQAAAQNLAASGNTPPPATASSEPASSISLKEAIDRVNQRLELGQRGVRVVSRPETSAPVIEIVDLETDQVVRQIPPEQVLKLAAYWEENGLLSQADGPGLAFDETA